MFKTETQKKASRFLAEERAKEMERQKKTKVKRLSTGGANLAELESSSESSGGTADIIKEWADDKDA